MVRPKLPQSTLHSVLYVEDGDKDRDEDKDTRANANVAMPSGASQRA